MLGHMDAAIDGDAVRAALGANRRRLIQQVVLEAHRHRPRSPGRGRAVLRRWVSRFWSAIPAARRPRRNRASRLEPVLGLDGHRARRRRSLAPRSWRLAVARQTCSRRWRRRARAASRAAAGGSKADSSSRRWRSPCCWPPARGCSSAASPTCARIDPGIEPSGCRGGRCDDAGAAAAANGRRAHRRTRWAARRRAGLTAVAATRSAAARLRRQLGLADAWQAGPPPELDRVPDGDPRLLHDDRHAAPRRPQPSTPTDRDTSDRVS